MTIPVPPTPQTAKSVKKKSKTAVQSANTLAPQLQMSAAAKAERLTLGHPVALSDVPRPKKYLAKKSFFKVVKDARKACVYAVSALMIALALTVPQHIWLADRYNNLESQSLALTEFVHTVESLQNDVHNKPLPSWDIELTHKAQSSLFEAVEYSVHTGHSIEDLDANFIHYLQLIFKNSKPDGTQLESGVEEIDNFAHSKLIKPTQATITNLQAETQDRSPVALTIARLGGLFAFIVVIINGVILSVRSRRLINLRLATAILCLAGANVLLFTTPGLGDWGSLWLPELSLQTGALALCTVAIPLIWRGFGKHLKEYPKWK